MASTLPPVKNATFAFTIALVSQADTDTFQATPTLAAGDVQVSLAGAQFANIGSLPTILDLASGADSGVLLVSLSAAEMNADYVTVLFHDAAGAEWQDALVTIFTAAQTLDTIEGLVDDIGIAGAGLTALGDTRLANLDAAVSSRSTYAGGAVASVTGSVGSVTGLNAANLDATISSRSSHSAADVWSVATRTLTSFGTLVADVWAYATRTLTSLSALVGGIADAVWDEATSGHATAGTTGKALSDAGAAGDPWAAAVRTLTQSAAQVAAVVSGTTITVTRGDTTSIAFTALGNITGQTQVWFAIKASTDDADTASIILVTRTGGLIYLNGAAPVAPITTADASIVVSDESTGAMTVTLSAAMTAQLAVRGGMEYDVQYKGSDSHIHTLTAGTANVSGDVSRATA